jgi:hypothetical protein
MRSEVPPPYATRADGHAAAYGDEGDGPVGVGDAGGGEADEGDGDG